MTPTQRTLAKLKTLGIGVATVERWIPGAMIRKDAFGWIDLLGMEPARGRLWGIQSTGEDFAGHLLKLRVEARPMVNLWGQCGGHGLLVGWRKIKAKRGGAAWSYQPRVAYMDPAHPGEWVEDHQVADSGRWEALGAPSMYD